MRVGVRSDCFPADTPPEAVLARTRAVGYDFVEVALPGDGEIPVASSLQPWAVAVGTTTVPVRSVATAHCVHLLRRSARERAGCADRLVEIVRQAARIGADAVLVAITEAEPVHGDAAAIAIAEAVDRAGAVAAELGVTIALEHVGDTRPDHVALLVESVANAAVRLYFDVGNCYHVGLDPLRQAARCAPWVAHLHLKRGPVTPLAAMPLAEVAAILAASGFAGRACLEEPPSTGGSSRHLLDARAVLQLAGILAADAAPRRDVYAEAAPSW